MVVIDDIVERSRTDTSVELTQMGAGQQTSTVPSPVKSVRKISPAPNPELGTTSEFGSGESKWAMVLS